MSLVTLERHPHNIVWLYLDRPDKHNAMNDVMLRELAEQLHLLAQEAVGGQENRDANPIRALVVAARGQNFCAGADLAWMRRTASYAFEENVQDASILSLMLQRLSTFPAPTIALAQGKVMGGGLGLLSCVDIAITTTASTFCFSEAKLGLVPAIISPYVVRAIGQRAASRYFLTGEVFDAARAVAMGLAHEAVAPEDLKEAGDAVIAALLRGAPGAQRIMKELTRRVADTPLDAKLRQDTITCIAEVRAMPEAQHGIQSFFDKTCPRWNPSHGEAEPSGHQESSTLGTSPSPVIPGERSSGL